MADSNSERRIAPLFTWRSAISESCLKPVERHCLLALSLYMNERGGSAYPGSTRLAHDTGYHVDTVKRALRVASDSGWLRVVVKGGSPEGGPRRATEYVAHTPVVDSDRGSTTTGGPESADRGSEPALPGVHALPITSLNTPMNSSATEPDFQQSKPEFNGRSLPPWVAEGVSLDEWILRSHVAEGVES